MTVLLLDLDRTLVDVQSYTDYEAAVRALEARFGELPDAAGPETYWRPATRRAMDVLLAWSGMPWWEEASAIVEAHELAAVTASTPMPALEGFLAATAEVPRVVVTLMGPAAARATLDHHGVGIGPLVGREPHLAPKPAADQVLAGLDLLGASPADAVMVGDSSWDAEAARAAGVRFVGVGSSDFGPEVPVAADLAGVVDLL